MGVQQGERDPPRGKRLLAQPDQHARVLADRVEEDRALEPGDHLTEDVDALCLEHIEVRQLIAFHRL